MPYDIAAIRNIGIIAHIDAGKTTVTERMLYYAHFTHRVGEVDKGTTVTDFDPEEQQRGITIQSACVSFEWEAQAAWAASLPRRKIRVNLIDTPGHVDFTAEVERSLRVLDGAVVIFSAVEGVEAQSETVWRQADKYHVPRLCFINKMDRIGADFDYAVSTMRNRLGVSFVVIQVLIGSASEFTGVVDVIVRRAYVWDNDTLGATFSVSEVTTEISPVSHRPRQRPVRACPVRHNLTGGWQRNRVGHVPS
mgnify:CR=1 FL=1